MDRESARQEIRRNWRYFYPKDKSGKGIICPLCNNGSGSDGDGVVENPKAKERGSLICFKCGFRGDILDLLQKNTGADYDTALSMAADQLGIVIDPYRPAGSFGWGDEVQKPPQSATERPQSVETSAGDNLTAAASETQQRATQGVIDYTAYYRECRARLNDPAAVSYLQARGISPETAAAYWVGFDPVWSSPTARSKGKNPPKSPRLIIPTSKEHYIARDIRQQLTDKQDKYKKMNEGSPRIFNEQVLFAQDVQKIFITEGAIDALSVIEAGATAIALNSTSNAAALLEKLGQQRPSATLILCLDNDDAGKKTTAELRAGLDRLNISHIAANISGSHKDPNEALTADRAAFCAAIEGALQQAGSKPDSVSCYINSLMGSDIARFKKDIKTGFLNLDEQAGGLYAGLYVVAAISSLGKTTFCHQMADQIAAAGNDVLFFSMEQSRLEMVSKSLARKTAQNGLKNAVTSLAIRRGYLPPNVTKAVKEYTEAVGDRLSIIEGNFSCDISFIGDKIRQYIRRNNARPVVFIDYLQILQPAEDEKGKKQSTKETVDSTVTELKRISRELDIPIFIISSVNRANYLTPIDFESLKESGGIEYTADVVYGLQLQCLNDPIFDKANNTKEKRQKVKEAKASTPRKVELVCLKNRYGVANFSCYFDYYPAADLFTECAVFDLDFIPETQTAQKAGRRL